MNLAMLIFELNDDETQQIKKLSEIARKKQKRQDNINWPILPYCAEEKEILKIYANAHKRALKYYGTHLDELTEALKREIKLNAIFIAAMEEGEAEKESRLETFLKENLKRDTAPYLAMLKENCPQEYDKIIAFIDYAFEHRAELYEKAREESGKKSGITAAISKVQSKRTDLTSPSTVEKSEALKHSPAKTTNSALSIMFNAKPTTTLGLARGKGKFDPFSRTLRVGDVNIFAPENIQKVGVGAAKAFRYILAEFTKHNSQNMPKDKIINRIFLNINDFAEANGIETNSSDTMKNFRRKLKGNLNILLTHKISWNEKVKGKKEHFPEMTWISAFKPTDNYVMVEVTQSMAEILALMPMIYFHRALYALDDRDYNAYAIGEAMCIHYCQENNVIKGTENKISVLKLLEKTSFPTYEELKENRWSWELYVFVPFENCLERLYQCGFLKNRVYCYSGGIELTDEEVRAGAIDSYEKFTSLLVKFELNDFEDHDTRVIEIVKKKAESKKKLQTKHKNSKNADKGSTADSRS